MSKPIEERRYGVVTIAERNAMSGLEFVQALVSGRLPMNSMAKTLGYDVTECDSGRVSVAAKPTSDYLNPEGTVHGGFSATLLDTCMGLAIRSMIDAGQGSTTLELKISMLRPITLETGEVKGTGLVLTKGRRVGVAEGRLTDQNGKLLAHGTTTCLIFDR